MVKWVEEDWYNKVKTVSPDLAKAGAAQQWIEKPKCKRVKTR